MSPRAIARGALEQVVRSERRHASGWIRRISQDAARRVKGERGDAYAWRAAAQEALEAIS